MKKEMTYEEFNDNYTIENRKVYEIKDELDKRGIKDLKSRLNFVEENYDGQYYMYFALKEVDDVILKNYNELNEEFILRKNPIDYLLRAFGFAIKFMPEGLPEHAYDYMKSNSNTFLYNLIDQYREQGVI
ncbi:hypothetical protein [Tepidibacter mesophilus]|uniref:hypothetical protein n=1 Tax=Tepidibacter mesophilus TaxID=655607 RepID=UPI000C08A081|nr:hypothetical protein [Tepidibacter mesophilus]